MTLSYSGGHFTTSETRINLSQFIHSFSTYYHIFSVSIFETVITCDAQILRLKCSFLRTKYTIFQSHVARNCFFLFFHFSRPSSKIFHHQKVRTRMYYSVEIIVNYGLFLASFSVILVTFFTFFDRTLIAENYILLTESV